MQKKTNMLTRGILTSHSVIYNTNRNAGPYARQRLRQYIGTAAEAHEEAAKVDGCECFVFLPQKLVGLKPCTCTMQKMPDEPEIEKDFLSFKAKDLSNPLEKPLIIEPETDVMENAISKASTVLTNSRCGICLGTLYKNSYQMSGGNIITLDAWNNPVLDNFSIDTSTKPTSYMSASGKYSSITFKTYFSPYFKKIIDICVSNNDVIVPCSITLSKDGSTWEKYSLEFFEGLKTDTDYGGYIWIKVTPMSELNTEFRMTHVSLIFSTADPVLLDFPVIEDTLNFDFFESIQTAKIEVPGYLSIPRGALIVETKNKMIWKVTSVAPVQSSAAQQYLSKLTLRKVQATEAPYYLNTLLNKKPVVVLNHKGLEQQQGIRHYEGEAPR